MPNKRTAYQIEYKRSHYKHVPLEIPKDKYEVIKNHAAARSESVNGFIKRAIDETMQNDLDGQQDSQN